MRLKKNFTTHYQIKDELDGHAVCKEETRSAYKILVGKYE
jgi:hypothetical protein